MPTNFDLWKCWPEVSTWCAQSYGYRWRLRFTGTLEERRAKLPSPAYWHVIDRPFGRPDWNNRQRLARYMVAGW